MFFEFIDLFFYDYYFLYIDREREREMFSSNGHSIYLNNLFQQECKKWKMKLQPLIHARLPAQASAAAA